MKSVWVVIYCLIIPLLFSSCVSQKKYSEALAWKQEYHELQSEYTQVLAEKERLKQNSSAALAKKEQDLQRKEDELAAREAKVAELNQMIENQRNAVHALKQEVCSALKCFTPEELQVEVKDGRLYVSLSDKLLFPSGSDRINTRGKEAIEMLSAVLVNSDLQIMVEGHTDSIPIGTVRNKDNWDLSVHRATSVVRLMKAAGIEPKRLIAAGRSKYQPVAENSTAEGRQVNRRTEIVLAPKLDKLWKLTEQEALVQK